MRITGGEAKGRVLASPKGMDIRPTSDRVREAIFNIIGQDLSGRKVLDLFAGTGSLGLEALSRFAQHAVFIDNSQNSIKIIMKNLAACGFKGSGTILKRDLKKGFALNHPMLRQHFDLIFLDPPYGKDLIIPLLGTFEATEILSNEARVIAESSKSEKLPRAVGNLEMADTRKYGDTRITIFSNEVTS
jgi:16S rRNA (guanine966-N2)-methyltransferase